MLGYLLALGAGAAAAYYYEQKHGPAPAASNANPAPAPPALPAPPPPPGTLTAVIPPATGALLTGIDPAVAHAQAVNIGDNVIVGTSALASFFDGLPDFSALQTFPNQEVQVHVDSLTVQDDPTGKIIIAHVNDPRVTEPAIAALLNSVSTPISRDLILRKVL